MSAEKGLFSTLRWPALSRKARNMGSKRLHDETRTRQQRPSGPPLDPAARRRIESTVLELARTTGVPVPKIRLLDKGASESVCIRPTWRPGHHLLTYSRLAAAKNDALVVRGSVAHELQHVKFGDTTLTHAARDTARALIPALAWFAVLVWGSPDLAQALQPALGHTAAAIIGLAFLAAWIWAGHKTWPRWFPCTPRQALHSRIRELRCDLAAVQVVGREPVLAMLHDLARVEAEDEAKAPTESWKEALLRRFSDRFPKTHPPTSMRLQAVAAYDPAEDPTEFARTWLARPASPR